MSKSPHDAVPAWVLRQAKFEFSTVSLIDENARTGRRLRRPYYLWFNDWLKPFDPSRIYRLLSDPAHATGDLQEAIAGFENNCGNPALGKRLKEAKP